jgi:hypothetical protein
MPFQVTQRQSIVFIAGLALGVAAAWAVFGRHGGTPAHGADAKVSAPAARSSVAPVSVAVGACAFTPVVATAAGDDGRVQVQDELSGRSPKDVDNWILQGKEAVAAGRQRDAEADFLMACRAAEKLADTGALPQAEAMYHLGRHYASLAGAVAEPQAGELLRRAEGLFSASLQTFNALYGGESDKTRFAAKGLAEVRGHGMGAPAAAAAPATAKAPQVKAPGVKTAPAKVEPPKEVAQAPAPKPATGPKPAKAPEHTVAVVKPTAPKPRPAREPAAQPDADTVVVEPPSRAAGSATGQAHAPAGDEPADTSP